jgi:hypothetical protein
LQREVLLVTAETSVMFRLNNKVKKTAISRKTMTSKRTAASASIPTDIAWSLLFLEISFSSQMINDTTMNAERKYNIAMPDHSRLREKR